MTLATKRLAFVDCYGIMDDAINNETGVRVAMKNVEDATFLRMRMNQARSISRKENKEIYKPGDPMYGQSAYDKLVFRIRTVERQVYIYAERIDKFEYVVEPLGANGVPVDDPPKPLREILQLAEPTPEAPIRRLK